MRYFGSISLSEVPPLAQSARRSIRRADQFQEQVHTRQWRKIVRQPHTDHTRYVGIVFNHFFREDTDGVVSALLHDTVEDAHKLARSIRRRFKVYYRKQDDRSLHQFLTQNVPACFLKFLNDIHGLQLYQETRDGSVGPLLPDEAIQNPQTIARLRRILTDDMQERFPRFSAGWYKIFTFRNMQERFRRFVAQHIHNEFGQDVEQTVYILTRETTHQKFNDAFADPFTREFIRRRAANIKALDTYHNLETMDIEINYNHAKGMIDRTIVLLPYLAPLLHPTIREVLEESLRKHYAALEGYHARHGMPPPPSLETRQGAAQKDYETAFARLNKPHNLLRRYGRRFSIHWQRMGARVRRATHLGRQLAGSFRNFGLH
jgi:hypothetical protein